MYLGTVRSACCLDARFYVQKYIGGTASYRVQWLVKYRQLLRKLTSLLVEQDRKGQAVPFTLFAITVLAALVSASQCEQPAGLADLRITAQGLSPPSLTIYWR